MRFDHINIHAADQEAMRDFLIKLLGLEAGWRPGFSFAGYWLYLGDQPIIHLQARKTPLHERGWADHIAFGLFDDAAAKRADLEALGFPFSHTQLPDTEIDQFFVTGPEGVKIELQCRRTPVRA